MTILVWLLILAGCLAITWVLSAAMFVDWEARQARRHRAAWLPPRTDPARAQRMRNR